MAKKQEAAKLSDDEVVITALAWGTLDAKIKELSKEADAKKASLKAYIEENGVEGSDGHVRMEKRHAGNVVTLTNESRVTNSLRSDAIDTVRKTRFGPQIIETYESINLDKLEKLHQNGKLSDEYIAKLFDSKTSFAFKMKVTKDDEN
jgi:hypothetical protein